MAITSKSKIALENLTVSGLTNNRSLLSHLKNVAYNMIQHRHQIGVDGELKYCQQIIDNDLTCTDANALEYEKEVRESIDGVTAGKRDDAISVYTDLIIGQVDKLFKVDPTPVPDLPKREEDIVVDKIEELIINLQQERIQNAVLGYMEELTFQGVEVTEQEALAAIQSSGVSFAPSNEEIFQIAQRMKGAATKVIRKRAVTGAKRMERNIHDITVETKYGDELLKAIHDYASYPYMVMRTGSHLPFTRKVWKGNKWVFEEQELPVAKRVSPVNFYWSADSLEINDGSAVGDVVYLRRADLESMYRFEKNNAIKDSIGKTVQMCNSFESSRNWLEYLGHDKENKEREEYSPWPTGSTVPCFRIHTLIDACKLRELGLNPDGEIQQYEVEAWLLNDAIIRFKVFDPRNYSRPYVMEKFRHIPGRFEGKSLAKILQPLEHQIRSVKRNELLNIGFSSAPVTTRDTRAFPDEDELPDVIQPGDNYDTRSIPGSTVRPIEFQIIPNITGQLRQVLFDLQAEADVKSQIPRLLTGQGQLGSSIRSASMLATQISGASKNLKRQMWLLARNVIIPHIENVFEFEMRNSKDVRSKVDAAIQVGSIEALVNREFVLQNSQQLVQYLAPFVASGQIKQEVIDQLLFTILSESGISEGDDPELADEFSTLLGDATNNLGTPQAQSGVVLDGRSSIETINTGQLGR